MVNISLIGSRVCFPIDLTSEIEGTIIGIKNNDMLKIRCDDGFLWYGFEYQVIYI
jgi:hypothetical protein